MDAVLQPLKSRGFSFLIQRHDLAVEHDRRLAAFLCSVPSAAARSGNCAVFSLPSRDQILTGSRAAGVSFDKRPDAVVFGFVDERSIESGASSSVASIGRMGIR